MPLTIEIVKGDITRTNTQAIVNAANNHFWMGSGVAGAIKSAGGEIIEQEAVKKGPVMPGEAVYTSAGRLPFKVIIHAAVMGQDLHTTDKYIRQATISSLNIAETLKLESICIPCVRYRCRWVSYEGLFVCNDNGNPGVCHPGKIDRAGAALSVR